MLLSLQNSNQQQLAPFHLLSWLQFLRSSNLSASSRACSSFCCSFLSGNLRTPSGPSLCWQSSRLTTSVFTRSCSGDLPLFLMRPERRVRPGSETQEGEMVDWLTKALKERVEACMPGHCRMESYTQHRLHNYITS